MFLKKTFSYIVCLIMPKALAEAINDAASVSELDQAVMERSCTKCKS